MRKQTVITQKKRGPAPTGKGTLIGVRLQPSELSTLDNWIGIQADEPSRPEAIRRLVGEALASKRYRGPDMQQQVSEPRKRAVK